jgi:hypothetical protein
MAKYLEAPDWRGPMEPLPTTSMRPAIKPLAIKHTGMMSVVLLKRIKSASMITVKNKIKVPTNSVDAILPINKR